MENTQDANIQEYEEIDLRDVVAMLARRRRLIFGITIVAALAALVVSLSLPKTYNMKTILEVGTAPDGTALSQIDDPALVAKKIVSDFYGLAVRQKLGVSERNYPRLKVDNFSGNLISISTNSPDPKTAESILNELDNAVTNDYQPRAAQKKAVVLADIDVQKKDIDRLTNKAQSAEAERKDIEAEVSSLNNEVLYNKDIGLVLALTSDRRLLETNQQGIESLYLQINQNNQQINALKGLLDQMRPTAIITEPIVSQSPVSPRILLNTVLGAALGLFFGIFWAFGAAWWKKNA